jgi:hypothetical protein
MSDATHGGKGDRNRVNDLDAWRENYDKIFGKTRTVIVEDKTPSSASKEIYNDVIEEIVQFLKHIDSEEYPVEKAKELYKKYLTVR